ncbi:MAG: CheR family methyltransferase [Candidatus Deferrimicrobiaceae bacterium]
MRGQVQRQAPASYGLEPELTDREFDRFRRIIYETSRIALNDGKKELLRARLGKILRPRGIASFREYLTLVEEDRTGEELTFLLDAISTNLTSFFREGDHFRFLETTVLPHLDATRKARGERKIRAWSAGCSSGEEPYSLAITLLDALGGGAGWDIRLLATDLSTKVLAMARNGLYASDRVKGVSPQVVARHFFTETGNDGRKFFRVSPAVRGLITFGHLNLLEPYPFRGPFDFIFCRNVMIYFDKKTQETLVNGFYRYLADGGHLFIGLSESLNGVAHSFQYVRPSVYRKTEGSSVRKTG